MPRTVGLDHRGPPRGVGTPRVEVHRELHQRGPGLTIHGEQLGHNGGLGRVNRHACRIARSVRAHPVAIRRIGPGQKRAGTQLGQSPAAHALGDQGPLILGRGAADLQQQMVVRVVAHGTVQELRGASGTRPFLQEHHLVDVVACKAVRSRDEHSVHLMTFDGVAQTVETRACQHGATHCRRS